MPSKFRRLILLSVIALCAAPLSAADVEVTLSPDTPPAFSNQVLDTNVPLVEFMLEAAGGDVTLTGVTMTFSNAASAGDAFNAVRVFFDADGNGVFSAGEEVDSFKDPSGGATLTFTENFTVLSGLQRRLQVQVDIDSAASEYGESYTVSIAASSDLPRMTGTDTVSGTFPVTGNNLVLRNSLVALAPGSGNFTAPRNVARGTLNAPALHFMLDSRTATSPGELVGIDLESLTVTINMAAAANAGVVDGVELYGDDGDATFEPGSGDNLILRRTSADSASWSVTGAVLTVIFDGAEIVALTDIASGSTRSFWVAYDLNSTADAQLEAQVQRTGVIGSEGVTGDFILNTPAAVSGQSMFVVSSGGGGGGGGGGDQSGEEGGCAAALAAPPLALLAFLPLFLRRRRHARD